MGNASRWFLEGEKKRKKSEQKSFGRAIPQYKVVGKSMVRNNPGKSSNNFFDSLGSLFDILQRTKMPDNSKLNKNEQSSSTRGNKRIGNYNGKDFSDDPIKFITGNLKEFGGHTLSTIGTIRNKIGGADMQDHMDASYDELMNAIKSGKPYDGIAVKKKSEEQTKKSNQALIDTADKLINSGAEDIKKIKEGKNSFEKRMIDVGSGGAQMLGDWAVGGGLGKVAKVGAKGLNRAINFTMGSRAAGGAMSEARQDGATENEQLLYGLLAGSVEIGTEKLGNLGKPFKKLYGNGVTDEWTEKLAGAAAKKLAKSKVGKDVAYNLAKLGLTATEEGAEEMLSEIASPYLKNMTYKDGETVDWNNVLDAGINGAILGGALGGAGQVVDSSRKSDYVKKSGLDKPENVRALVGEGLAADETTPANRIANQLKSTVESGAKPSAREIVSLQQANKEAIEAENYAYEKQKRVAEKAADRQGLAPIMIDSGDGKTVVGGATAQRLKETTGRVVSKLAATQTVDEGTAMDTAASISRIMVGMGDSNDFSALLPTLENEPVRQVYMEETGRTLPDTNEGTRAVLSQANMTNMLMMRQEETKYQNQQQKQAIVDEAESSFGKEGAGVFANMMQGMDGSYDSAMREFKNYYDGGTVNYPAAQIEKQLGQGMLPYPMKMAAWQAGFRDSESRKQSVSEPQRNGSNKKTSYSIEYTTENSPVVKIDKDILGNAPKEKWQEVVRNEMKKFSEGIPVHGKLIKVNAKGRKEFTKGKTTEFYKKNDQGLYKDKLNSGTNAGELIWASTDYINESPKHPRNDGFTGFARGKVLLQVGMNKYDASVIIGGKANGEMFLYDVVDYTPVDFVLKSKEDANPQFQEQNSSRRSRVAPSKNSIANIKKKDNPKNAGTFKSNVAPAVVAKEAQDMLKSLAGALRVNIQLDPILEHDANGYYKDGTIHLSAKTENPLMSVFKHELTHHIKETAPAEYQKLKDYVAQEYYKGDKEAFQAAIDEKVRAYAKQGEQLTRDQAMDEIVAATAEKFLTDEATIENVVKQDRTLGQTILDAIRNMIESIKGLMQGRSKELDVLRRAEKLWGDALKVSVKGSSTVASQQSKNYKLNESFSSELDHWYNNEKEFRKIGGFFNVGTTSVTLKSIGVKDNNIIWDKSKIKKILNDHNEMTIDVIKQVPNILENPIIVMQSKTRLNSITLFGEVFADGMPILTALQLNPKSKNGKVLNLSKIASAYGRKNAQGMIDTSEILFINPNKNRTDAWLRASGLQLPVGLTKYGSIDKVTYYDDVVNNTNDKNEPTAMELAMEKAKSKKKYSFKDHPDEQALIDYESLTVKPDMKIVKMESFEMDGKNRKDVVSAARIGIKKLGGLKNGQYVVHNDDVNSDIIVGKNALTHGLNRHYDSAAQVTANIGEYLKNAVKINELIPREANIKTSYILLGYGTTKNDLYPAYFVVNTYENGDMRLDDFDVLYSANAKKIEGSALSSQGFNTSLPSTISISDLLDIVNDIYSDILPRSVAEHYGTTRKESKLGKSVVYSLKDHPDEQALIDYESLTEKPDMKIVLLNKADVRNLTRKDIIDAGRKNAEKYGGKDELNRIYVRNIELNSDIIVGAPAIRHGLQRDYESNALVAMNLGEYLENAIKVNEIIPRSSEARNGHILLGYGRAESGVQYPAYFVVQTLTSGKDELIEFESLYSFNGKKIVEAVGSANQGVQSLTSTTISIADLLDIVNETYSDILPKSVADHYRNERRETKLGKSVKYSLKDHPDEQALIDYMNAGSETKFIDMPPVRDYERKAKTVRMKSVEELTLQVEQLQQETKLTHGKIADQRDLINQSTNLVRTLMGGKVNKKLVDMCANNTGKMFTSIKRGHEDDAVLQAYNTARELVENLDLADDTLYQEYKSLRNYLRKTPIKVSENDKPADYNDFRAAQLGRLKLTSKEGLPVDTVYEELKELYPALFTENITHPADQLRQIADVRDSLDPYDRVLNSEETEQLIKEAASSLLEIAYNGVPKRTFADKKKAFYDAKVKRLKEEQKEAKEKLRAQYQDIVKKHDEKARQRRIDDKIKARNKADKKKFADRVEKNVGWLSDRLVRPTDEKHLPHGFEKAVADLLGCIDLQTERSKKRELKFGKSQKTLNFESLMRQYEKIAQEDGSGEIEYDGYVLELMDALAEKLQGKSIDQASNADLNEIDTLLKAIAGNFRNINKVFSENIKQSISDLGEKAIAEFQAKSAKRKGSGRNDNLVDRILNESMVTPGDSFEIMGGSMELLYKNIRKGFDVHIRNIDHTRKFFEEMFQKYYNKKKPGSKIQSWSEAKEQREFKLEQGGTIKLNPAQAMSLYCLNKREQAQGHIYASGIVASEVTEGRKLAQKLRGEKSNTSKANHVTMNDVETILSTLKPEQVEIADKLTEYLNTTCADWGNETSLRMNNYEKFKEKNYFPITSAKEYLDADFSKRANNFVETIKNASFTKNTVINANNPIMVADIFEVVTDHVNKMSMYKAFATPIADFQRVFNYKQRDEMGLQRTSVQVEMREAFGNKALDYIRNLMANLNNFASTRKDPFENLLNKSLATYKKAAIGFNFRVAIQQPTAIARAFAHINPMYFVNGKLNMKRNLQEMKEHCPIALWKSWGFSQTDVARDMKDIIMNDDWTKLDLVSMKPYGALDNATWATIWAAVKTETEAKHKDVEVGSDKFWEICSERASYIFDRTQVVDSPLHRSQVMRSQDVGMKMVTSFMAEPTRTYNMCRTELLKGVAETKDGKVAAGTARIGRVTTVFVLNAALVSAAAAVADAIREKVPGGGGDGDDEKSRLEYWLLNFWANLGDNLNPINMIPGLKDVWSMKDGWGTSNMALEGAEAMVMAVTNWEKYINGESKKTPSELIRKSAEAIGMVTGVPVKNMIREFESWTKLAGLEVHAVTKGDEKPESEKNLFDKFRDWLGKSQKKEKDEGEKTYDEKVSDIKEAADGLSGNEKQDVIWKKSTKGYTKSIDDGDFEHIAEIRKLLEECGGDVDAFDDKVLKAVKSSFKKGVGSTGSDARMGQYRDYLYEAGYTDGKISQELVCKSDVAKDFQEVANFNDEDKMVDTCAALILAGGQKTDIYALYENRSKAISAADYSTGEFQFPTDGRISSEFGHRSSPGGIGSTDHKGIDIAAAAGSDVNAADGGKVDFIGYNSSRGVYVRVSHGNGRTTLYQHLDDYVVQKGDVVQKGQVIAHVGSTGNSTGPHLHFEVKENGSYINPMMYFQ